MLHIPSLIKRNQKMFDSDWSAQRQNVPPYIFLSEWLSALYSFLSSKCTSGNSRAFALPYRNALYTSRQYKIYFSLLIGSTIYASFSYLTRAQRALWQFSCLIYLGTQNRSRFSVATTASLAALYGTRVSQISYKEELRKAKEWM